MGGLRLSQWYVTVCCWASSFKVAILIGLLDAEDSGVRLFYESDVSCLGCFSFILPFKNNSLSVNCVTHRRSWCVNDNFCV
jgi:hypothetical protein